MAMFTVTRRLPPGGDKNMAIIFIFLLVCLRVCIGKAHIATSLSPRTPFPDEEHSVRNITEIDTRSFGPSTSTSASPSAQTGGTPSTDSAGSTSTSVITDLGMILDDGKAGVARFIPSLTSDCLQKLQDYATLSSDFVYCALAYSKPLLFCETCVDKFTETERVFREIGEMEECGASLLSSDRVQVLRETHRFLTDLWKKGSCGNCFQDMKKCQVNTEQQECKVTQKVMTFQNYNNDVLNCFEAAASNNKNVCVNCSEPYRKLSKFYSSMGDVEDICIDCVEQMNSTRKAWSVGYNCTRTRKDVVSIVAISVFFCSLPLFFYIGSKVHTVKSEYKLMKQSRLKKPHRHSRPKLVTIPEHVTEYLTNDSTCDSI